jgi:hypothetical protein
MTQVQFAILVAIAATCSPLYAQADDEAAERERIIDRLESILRDADELEEAGRLDQAERLRDEAGELKRELGGQREIRDEEFRGEVDKRELVLHQIESLLRKADEFQENGRPDQADRLRQEASELQREIKVGREDHEHGPHSQEGFERMDHVHQAVEHLHAAGLHDLAEAAAQRAEEMERDLHRQMEERERVERERREHAERAGHEHLEHEHHQEHPPELAEIHEVVAALREEIEALRREVGELREQQR